MSHVYFTLVVFVALFSCAFANSCDLCMSSDATVYLDVSLSYNDALASVSQNIQSLCESTFLSEWQVDECLDIAELFISDLYVDLHSEGEHAEEKKSLSTSQLCRIVSACQTSCCNTDWNPEQVHLSIGNDYTEMVVSWVTYMQLTEPTVAYWEYNSNPNNVTVSAVTANITTYTAGGWVGTIYNATMTNLRPGTRYTYKIGGVEYGYDEITIEHHFTTDVEPSADPLQSRNLLEPLTAFVPNVTASVIAYLGDMGTTDKSYETALSLITLAQNRSVQMVVQGGDLSYADGVESVWDSYMRMNAGFSNNIPMMTAPGNHENYYLFDAYRHRFFMPWEKSGSHQYYSFNYEKIHFVSWSFEEFKGVDLRPGGKQRLWLEADLAQANTERDVRPWIILFGHRPFYCSSDSKDCKDVAEDLRELLEDLINEYHIDVVLQAHKHNYERTYPVYNDEALQTDYENPQGPMYYVVGTGGVEKNTDFQNDQPDWSAAREDKYGSLLISAPDEYSLEMTYISKSFNIHDSATITRSGPISSWSFANQ